MGDLLANVARLESKKVSLWVLSMSGNQALLDAATSTGRLMLRVIAAVGQAEREGRYKGRVADREAARW